MISQVFALLLSTVLSQPQIDSKCLASPMRIATDNVPVGSEVPTSVVNIWGFGSSDGGETVGWLYKNLRGDYYMQLNYKAKLDQYRGVPMSGLLLAKPKTGVYKPIVKVSAEELIAIENALLARGVARSGCFASDFVMPKR